MPTPFSVPIERFLHMIEEDRDFFQYFGLSDDEALELARRRSVHYLCDAAARIMLECSPSIDFCAYDMAAAQFDEELTNKEVFLLASIMYEFYYKKDMARLKTYELNYTAADLRVFSPSEYRTSYLSMFERICSQNKDLLDLYRNTDRLTGAYKTVGYSAYSEE